VCNIRHVELSGFSLLAYDDSNRIRQVDLLRVTPFDGRINMEMSTSLQVSKCLVTAGTNKAK